MWILNIKQFKMQLLCIFDSIFLVRLIGRLISVSKHIDI